MGHRRSRLTLSIATAVLVAVVSCVHHAIRRPRRFPRAARPWPRALRRRFPPTPTPRPTGTAPTQTDTDWGRIWDGLPDGFPEYPGAALSETGEGPASAILDVGDVEPAEVAGYYVPALERLGYSTLARSDPREDGSIEVEWAGEGTCAIRITATPAGGTTLVEVLYGSGCPFE